MLRRLMLNSFKSSSSGEDADATAYINAIESTGVTLSDDYKIAINTFFLSLKMGGLYDKIFAMYPFIGGTSASHKFNAVNPIDTDGAYRLSFINSPTHNADGITFNGADNYANTFLANKPSSMTIYQAKISLSYYSKTNGDKGIDIGVEGGNVLRLGISLGGTCYNELGGSDPSFSAAPYNKIGLFTTSKNGIGEPRNFYINGILYRTDTTSGAGANANPFFIGCESNAGTPQYFSARNCAFAGIENGFSESQALAYYNAIQTLQVALGREV